MKTIIKIILRKFNRPFLLSISKFLMPFLKFFFKGKKYYCPICRFSARTFLPYGYGKNIRANRLCPSCFSLERHRLIWLYLKIKTKFFKEKHHVLHIAPEQPFINRFKQLNNLKYVTCDLYSPLADIKADIQKLPFADNQFDVIICNHVLEHVEDDIKAMKELLRVLKPNGFAILQVPINYNYDNTFEDPSIRDPKEREKVFGQYDHVRIYGKDYPSRLASVGFVVESINYSNELSEQEINLFRIDKNEILYICTKNE